MKDTTFLSDPKKIIPLKQKYISANKETLAKIVIHADQGQKLAEALEDNNQELKILLHSLIYDSNKQKNGKRCVGFIFTTNARRNHQQRI